MDDEAFVLLLCNGLATVGYIDALVACVDLATERVPPVAVSANEVRLSFRILPSLYGVVGDLAVPAVLPLQVYLVICKAQNSTRV